MATVNAELYLALREAGASHEKADAAARVTPSVGQTSGESDMKKILAELRFLRRLAVVLFAALAVFFGKQILTGDSVFAFAAVALMFVAAWAVVSAWNTPRVPGLDS